MSMLRRSVYLTLVVGLFVATGARPALAGCTQASEAKAVKKSTHARRPVQQPEAPIGARRHVSAERAAGVRRDPRRRRGRARLRANNPAAAAVDRQVLRTQLSCQRRVGKAVSTYVGRYLA